MGIRLMVVLLVSYVVQLVLYFTGTILINTTSTTLLNGPYGNTPGLGPFLASMNVEFQAGLAVEGLVILAMFFVVAFRRRGDTGQL